MEENGAHGVVVQAAAERNDFHVIPYSFVLHSIGRLLLSLAAPFVM